MPSPNHLSALDARLLELNNSREFPFVPYPWHVLHRNEDGITSIAIFYKNKNLTGVLPANKTSEAASVFIETYDSLGDPLERLVFLINHKPNPESASPDVENSSQPPLDSLNTTQT